MKIIGTWSTPGSEIDARQDDFLATIGDKGIDFLENFFEGSPLVSSACLYGETKGAKIVTTRLNDKVFTRKDLLETFIAKRAKFGLHHTLFVLGAQGKITRIFRKNLDCITKIQEFVIDIKKLWIDDTISNISTS